MPEVIETWENVYSGFDCPYGTTKWVLRIAERHLPKPEISPTCKKKGHNWKELPSLYSRQYFPTSWSDLFGCERCAKRGLVVLRTDGHHDA